MEFSAGWITWDESSDVCPVFRRRWKETKTAANALLYITCIGVYEAVLNDRRVGEFVLAPGWTSYEKRLQVQCYDVTDLIREENKLQVTIGKGWAASPMPGFADTAGRRKRVQQKRSLLAQLEINYEDGSQKTICTDNSWEWAESSVRFSEIYDGEHKDASFAPTEWKKAEEIHLPLDCLIPQEGEEIREMERVQAKEILHTPAGEVLVDFGQEVTGYIELRVKAKKGDRIRILHGEVLDRNGNFYNANYRSARAEIIYVCKDGVQRWHPQLTFFGFRYIKLAEFPGTPSPDQFTAVVIYSNIRRTGNIQTSDPLLNQLISNVFWSQKGNFLDVPTDCPQRDERLGWTGDAQAFVKAASYNYDVESFFRKWLRDVRADQRPDGGVGQVIPDYLEDGAPSAAWGDAATICPWQIYLTYGNKEVLQEQFQTMKGWVNYITRVTKKDNLWIGGSHFGDWLGLDAESGSYKGSSREDLIASAFYAYSTQLVIKAGKVLGEDVRVYEELYPKIVQTFREEYPQYYTQTECVLALQFHLASDPKETAEKLAVMITEAGAQMKTGFVGTPYLLHVLSDNGYADLAWSLLFRKEYPSWLYSVKKGATTTWEHWDGIMEDGSFWSDDMNSYNHYAYGAVIDWLYEKAAGIQTVEKAPGFKEILLAPMPDKRLGWMEASIETRQGLVCSKWEWIKDKVRYSFTIPSAAAIRIDGRLFEVPGGEYTFWGNGEGNSSNL